MFGRAMMPAGWHVAADHLADGLGPFPANIAFMGVRHKRQPIGTCLPARLHTGGAVACRHSRLTISIGAAVDGVLDHPMDGVATKPTNKAGRPVAEPVEPRPGTKGNADQQSTHRAQSRARVTQAPGRVRLAARQRKKDKLTALLHHISIDTLRTAFYALKRKAAPGVDGMTWHDYEADLELRTEDLHGRVHRGAYRPQPPRRAYIDKADGKQRPLAIAALEDKIVQGATVMVLNAIYEGDFVGFSYGFRPGRGPHDALDALSTAIKIRKVNWILDADIRNFFGAVSQDWLVRFLEHRIGDKRIIRLIQKWLRAGILEDGVVTVDDRGTGQGSVISPILANIYLHYCFDLWAERWRRQEARGDR